MQKSGWTLVTLACLWAVASGIGHGETRYAQWQKTRPFIQSAWYTSVVSAPDGTQGPPPSLPPQWPLPNMELYRRSGLNLVSDVSGFRAKWEGKPGEGYPAIARAQAAGVPYFITPYAEMPLETLERFVGHLANDPRWSGLAGVYLKDEPSPDKGDDWRWLSKARPFIAERWPHLLLFVSHASGSPSGMSPHLRWIHEKMAEDLKPDVIVHQSYPFHWGTAGRAMAIWYPLMDYYGEWHKKHGIGYWGMPETYSMKPRLSESALRLNKFAALAYGVQGFIDWGYDMYHYDEPIFGDADNEMQYVKIVKGPDGTLKEVPTKTFGTHAQINREVANIAKSLIRLRHVRTYHVDAVPTFHSLGPEIAYDAPKLYPIWAPDRYYDLFQCPVHRFMEKDDLRTGKLLNVYGTSSPFVGAE